MKPDSTSNAQSAQSSAAPLATQDEISEIIRKLSVSFQNQTASSKVSLEASQDLKTPSGTNNIAQADPAPEKEHRRHSSRKASVNTTNMNPAMRFITSTLDPKTIIQKDSNGDLAVRKSSRKKSDQSTRSSRSNQDEDGNIQPQREERKTSRRNNNDEQRKMSSTTSRTQIQQAETDTLPRSKTHRRSREAHVTNGSGHPESSQEKLYTIKIKGRDGLTRDIRVMSDVHPSKDPDLMRYAREISDRRERQEFEVQRKASLNNDMLRYSAAYPRYKYLAPNHPSLQGQHLSPYARTYSSGDINYSDIPHRTRTIRPSISQDPFAYEIEASQTRQDSLRAEIEELRATVENLSQYNNSISSSATDNVSYRVQEPSYDAGVESFNLLDGLNVDFNDVKAAIAETSKHKFISSQNSNCWMRSTWVALLSQMSTEDFVSKVVNKLGESHRDTARDFSQLIRPLWSDASRIFTAYSDEIPLRRQDSMLKYPDESHFTEFPMAEFHMCRLTEALLKAEGIDEEEVSHYIHSNEFGGDRFLEALANAMSTKLMTLSDVTKEVTVYAPRGSELARQLDGALGGQNGENEEDVATRKLVITSLLEDGFSHTPVVLHMDLSQLDNPDPEELRAQQADENRYRYMTGNHFEVFIPRLISRNL